MTQHQLTITSLPASPLAAAAAFHQHHMPDIMDILDRNPASLVILLESAPYDHAGWRRAVVEDLARAHAPVRVNMLAGGDEQAVADACAYLANASGVTGQLFNLNSQNADDPI